MRRSALICCWTCLLAGWAWAESTRQTAGPHDHPTVAVVGEDVADGHHERPDDPYMPPAPRLPGQGIVAADPVVLGPYVSVQVNIDDTGENVFADAGNEPSMAIDPTDPDRIVIGWRQFDTVSSNYRQAGYSYSTNGGRTWSPQAVLDPGQFRTDPVLRADSAGNIYYSSLSTTALDSVELFKTSDGGVTWSDPVSAFGGDKQWIAVDRTGGLGDGHIYQTWNSQFSCCGSTDFARSIDGGASFEPPISMPSPKLKWGTLTALPDGKLLIAASNLSQTAHHIAHSSNAMDPSQTPVIDFVMSVSLGGTTTAFAGGGSPSPAGLLGQVWIVSDHSGGPMHGNVYVLASVNPPGGDPLDVMFIRSIDGGFSFTPPVKITDEGVANTWQWFGSISVAPNGRLDVFWNDTRNSGMANFSELFYAYSPDGGETWSRNVAVSPVFDSHVGFPNQNKLGDYHDTISDETGVAIAYAATFNGEQDVFFLRVGVPDADNDRDVDMRDFADFQICFTGEEGGVFEGCELFDVDRDDDVDVTDYLGIRDLLNGPF